MATTVAEMIARVRSGADLGAASSSAEDDFIPDNEIIDWLNDADTKLYYKLIESGLMIRESTQDITATGATSYPLGTNDTLFSIIGVARMTGQGTAFFPLDRHGNRAFLGTGDVGVAESYRVFEGAAGALNIEFWPIPTYGIYRVKYVPGRTKLVSNTDAVYYPRGWEKYLILCAIVEAKMKGEEQPVEFLRERDGIWDEVVNAAKNREASNTNNIENTDDPYRGYPRSWARRWW